MSSRNQSFSGLVSNRMMSRTPWTASPLTSMDKYETIRQTIITIATTENLSQNWNVKLTSFTLFSEKTYFSLPL